MQIIPECSSEQYISIDSIENNSYESKNFEHSKRLIDNGIKIKGFQ
jgi:hypothetical protein